MAAASELDPFPLRQMLKGYDKEMFKADSRSGLDGALLAIPQGMAFAVVAGLPLAYGITCSAVACVVGALLMSSRHSIYGPTNATAFMVLKQGQQPQRIGQTASERLFLAYNRNHGMECRVARYHNIFGPEGTWDGGKEIFPLARYYHKVGVISNEVLELAVVDDRAQSGKAWIFCLRAGTGKEKVMVDLCRAVLTELNKDS